ncbi:MAG: hypothetical protein ACI9KE_000420 [Polyangiales bacterium]|jgi:hypothetical protein
MTRVPLSLAAITGLLLFCIALIGAGCGDDDGARDSGPALDAASDVAVDATVSDQCIAVESLVPPLSCVRATQSDIVCPGSCGQTLEGPVGVGLTTCRCVDGVIGGVWECDLSGCAMDAGADAGVPLDAAADAPIAPMDAGPVDECPAAYSALSRGECPLPFTEAEFQDILCESTRAISSECSGILDVWLACVQTAAIVCEEIADGIIVPSTPSCADVPPECIPEI